MNFKEFVDVDSGSEQGMTDFEVVNYYLHHRSTPVREIASISGRSVGELYRILHRYGQPNRSQSNKGAVIALADSNLSPRQIANLTGYTPRHVRNILLQLEN
jgi:hypothetical protein